ncbi:glycosyltransferase family 2 protein [Loktanella sp. Alg231-35]|uniref:glycosyltransferase family 2 protein n=1 Tax=Loktanella sp. Alg231-35 TaxID=1922220 RepID=UPI000D54D096|nr:glycosyltransferase family 2 protein [Loktanella sp. Alg231-35]
MNISLGESSRSQRPDPPVGVDNQPLEIAVLIPCYNEEASIGIVVNDFLQALPHATIYVYDNNSTDGTAAQASMAGAIVRTERQQGKGNVVRRMFADISADVFVMVDGDNTYDASAAPELIEHLLTDRLDMVTGSRVSEIKEAYRQGHQFGNWLLTTLVANIFGRQTKDMLSGYRVMSQRFVKSFPVMSHGFEIETELTVHALELRLPVSDVDTVYINRLPGSESKLSTFKDGWRILRTIMTLVKEERPIQFFALITALFLIAALVVGLPIVFEFIETGLVPRFPSAVLAASLVVISVLSFLAGIILDTVTLGRREAKRMHYLTLPATQYRQ